MNLLDNIRSLWNKPQPEKRKRSPRSYSLAIKGRDSQIDPYYRSGTLSAIQLPKGQRRFAVDKLKEGKIENANLSDGIRILIDASDALSIAVDTAIDYTVDEISIEPKDATNSDDIRAVEIVKEFHAEHEKGNEPILATFKRFAYDIHVEGGCGIE